MPARNSKNNDYQKLASPSSSAAAPTGKNGKSSGDFQTLKPSSKQKPEENPKPNNSPFSSAPETLINPRSSRTDLDDSKAELNDSNSKEPFVEEFLQKNTASENLPLVKKNVEIIAASAPQAAIEKAFSGDEQNGLNYAELQKQKRGQKKAEQDRKLLSRDRWLGRKGHTLTYIGIFLFTLVVYFRPYELTPALAGFRSLALIIAVATLLVYLPTQFASEGSLTILTTEVKCVLFIAFWALLTIPIAKEPSTAWATFNDTFIRVIVIFIMMVNTLRTRARLKGLMWLSIGVAVMLSFQAIQMAHEGVFNTEGYRVSVDFGGMFGNPNDMALHLVIFTPIAIALGLAARNKLTRLLYFAVAGMMVAGNMVTQSRGGFLGLLAIAAVLVWKLGKRQRFKVILISLVVGALGIALAPGDYGTRILSIFIPSLDGVGSSDQRKELLQISLMVTLRNPQGIGIGNFPIVGVQNLQTHNAYTQVSSELGWLAFACYVVFIVSPLKKLAAIERQLFSENDTSWFYYLSIGIQASIAGYMVSSFFGAVAYNWFVYYPIAYAVCLRRIYQASRTEKDLETERAESGLSNYFDLQKA
jgi:putative inorganic carbon (HCO3(-)) transporter